MNLCIHIKILNKPLCELLCFDAVIILLGQLFLFCYVFSAKENFQTFSIRIRKIIKKNLIKLHQMFNLLPLYGFLDHTFNPIRREIIFAKQLQFNYIELNSVTRRMN